MLPGEKWEALLRDELKNCRAVVVIWTVNSVKSEWVKLEASKGLEIDGLVPIQMDSFEAAPVPEKFANIHASDLTTWRGDSHHSEFVSGRTSFAGRHFSTINCTKSCRQH